LQEKKNILKDIPKVQNYSIGHFLREVLNPKLCPSLNPSKLGKFMANSISLPINA
jgi:hypothetical protein